VSWAGIELPALPRGGGVRGQHGSREVTGGLAARQAAATRRATGPRRRTRPAADLALRPETHPSAYMRASLVRHLTERVSWNMNLIRTYYRTHCEAFPIRTHVRAGVLGLPQPGAGLVSGRPAGTDNSATPRPPGPLDPGDHRDLAASRCRVRLARLGCCSRGAASPSRGRRVRADPAPADGAQAVWPARPSPPPGPIVFDPGS
jgi:hypothetical protein